MRNHLVKKLRLTVHVFAIGVCLVIFSSENALAVWCGTSECSTCGSHSWSKREECKFDSQAACNNEIDRIRRDMSVSGARFTCYEKGSGSSPSGGSSSGSGDLNSLAGEAIAKGLVYGNANMVALGGFAAILSGAMQANTTTPQDDGRAAAEAAAAAEQRRRLAEQERLAELQRQEEAKQRILGALKGAESSAELGLKMDSDQPLLVASTQGFFGSTAIVPVSPGALSAGGLQLKMGGDDAEQKSAKARLGFDTAGKMLGSDNLPPPPTVPPTYPAEKIKADKIEKVDNLNVSIKKVAEEQKALLSLLEKLKQSANPADSTLQDVEKMITAKADENQKLEKELLDLTAEDDPTETNSPPDGALARSGQ